MKPSTQKTHVTLDANIINKVRNLEIGDKFQLDNFPRAIVVETSRSNQWPYCKNCIMHGYEDSTTLQCPLLKACTARYRKDHASVRFEPVDVVVIK